VGIFSRKNQASLLKEELTESKVKELCRVAEMKTGSGNREGLGQCATPI
jgi:hypothetical protein